jgi:chromate transporter
MGPRESVTELTGAGPSFRDALHVWTRIGLLSFGGPAAQIALMHRELVEERGWIGERDFLTALSFCMLLPGPEAMQLATYVGWRLHGTRGGLAAGLLFVIPGALIVLALSILYGALGKTPIVEALFVGVKAAVLAIVAEALIRVARRALRAPFDWITAAAAFCALFFFGVPFPVVIGVAAIAGYVRGMGSVSPAAQQAPVRPVPLRDTLATLAIWLAVWIVPLVAIAALFGRDHILSELALFFSKLAVVTFGGAYAVLAYMAQQVVQGYGWLSPGEMLDGLGLAETTSGPLILVTEFVGYTAAFRLGGEPPLLMGVLGALVTLWATFAPCFLWIFVGAPYIERLTHAPRLAAALNAVTAAVVGVIANLSLWFTLHVIFRQVNAESAGPLQVLVPQAASVDVKALTLSLLAVVLVFLVRAGIVGTLATCALGALAWSYFGG